MPTGIKDIALAAGVSISTVSNAVNGKQNVGHSTRARILQLCSEMNYFPNAAGRSLKSAQSNTILFNFSDFDRSFYLKIIEGISNYASLQNYDLIICTSKSCEKFMLNQLTDGCIILDERMKSETLIRAARNDYPIVVLDRVLTHTNIKSVVVNNYDPMTELMNRILALGYTHFGFVGGPEHTDDHRERYQAFLDALHQHNIPFPQENYYRGNYHEKSGYQAAKICMLSNRMPQVLVCANDNMAIGAIKAFQEQGIQVPQDIAVTGFDDCESAETFSLTTVAVPNYERGYIAARCLLENIQGKNDQETMKLTVPIRWRNTVGTP